MTVFAEGAETLERFLNQPYRPSSSTPIVNFLPYGGEWKLEKDVLYAPAGSGFKLVYQSVEHSATFRMNAEIYLKSGMSGNAALITHVQKCGTGADAFDGYEFALYADEQAVMLGRHEQNFQMLTKVPCSIPENEWLAVEVRCQRVAEGNHLELWLQGKKVAQVLDKKPLSTGKVGFRPWQREVQYRNLSLDGTAIVLKKTVLGEMPYPETLQTEHLPPILVVCRSRLSRPYAVGLDFWQSRPFHPGCALKIIDPAHPQKEVQTIFSDPKGCIYDANLSYDGKTVYFSYRPEKNPHWHIYRIQIDGSGLKQLTDGTFYDVNPCPLPTGEIAFVSSRHFGHTVCQPGPSSNLFKMDADGSNIQCISMNTLSDFHPQMLPDGRLLFTRWEYIDRDLTYRQSLWTQNPDGTGYQLYFGNTVRDSGSFLQSRPLPGRSDCVVSVFTPHHGYPHGAIGLIHRQHGPEAEREVGYQYITQEIPSIGDRSFEGAYRDPYPLSETQFLCSYGKMLSEKETRFGIYLLNHKGEKRLLYEDSDPHMGAFFPLPLQAVAPPMQVASQQETPSEAFGTLLLVDVYEGLEPFIQRGKVAKIRIMEQVRKSEDLHGRAYDQSPVMSYGTYYAKRCWGEVPVESDGSAYFQVPALREIYLQVLDKEGRELQRMTSALQVMPGQQQSCIGCHENRRWSPPLSHHTLPQAAMRSPSIPQHPTWWKEITPLHPEADPQIIDFVTMVQPVLDRYCVECHQGKNPAGGYDLTGDKTRYFSMAYDNLLGKSRSYRQYHMATGRILPEEAAKEKPLVHFYWLLWTPSAVNQPLEAGILASRLEEYLNVEHCQKEISQNDKQRIYTWVDANVPYYATYANSRPQTPGKRDLWTGEWYNDFQEVYTRRCQSCHQAIETNQDTLGMSQSTTNWTGRFAWINLSHPENSPALTAHLPTPHGRGIPADGMFTTENDPDYQKMLRAIQRGREAMLAEPRADMPHFRFGKKEY